MTTKKSVALAKRAAKLYDSGYSVLEVATELETTYIKARALIRDGGSEVRDPSARLKGRPHTKKAAA